ncbi:conjugal transfer protein TraX [Serratia fonticola]|uniref:conjugal transfer protein TraX n=1 Tax=Serratia fonticola TaxID=47917 RepID=UPI001AEA3258|nr:conjugal transfer protein TraX [Serratia fonticola]MBP1039169.1 conjugal transfer protein TraX [Serratia fonticola]
MSNVKELISSAMTDVSGFSEPPEKNGGENTPPKKKPKRIAWKTANLVLPLWEAGRMIHAARYAAEKNAERFQRIWPEKAQQNKNVLSFDEAVAASGHSREVLIQRYLLSKRILLVMFLLASGLALLLPVTTLATMGTGAGIVLVRMLSLTFTISAFAGMLFVFAMKNQLRIWQLTTSELGSFALWRTKRHWFKDIFSWHSPF